MWALALHSVDSFNALFERLRAHAPYELIVTSTGSTVAAGPRTQSWPHLFLASADAQQTRAAIGWISKNLHPSALISTDIADACCPPESVDSPLFVPSNCIRAAGRTELGGGPILYEELPFDPGLQEVLRRSLDLTAGAPDTLKIFSSDRTLVKPVERRWVFDHLACRAWDAFSGEMILSGRRLGLKVGCLKALANPDSDRARSDLLAAWERLVRTSIDTVAGAVTPGG